MICTVTLYTILVKTGFTNIIFNYIKFWTITKALQKKKLKKSKKLNLIKFI
jgi:hypothetical protein